MNGLSKKAIEDRIRKVENSFSSSGWSKPQLLLKAQRLNAISEREFHASIPDEYQTLKCYLWTLVQDDAIRETIDKYVRCHSLLYTRAFFILNLCFHRMAGIPYSRPQELDTSVNKFWSARKQDEDPRQSTLIFDRLFAKESKLSMFLSQCYLPELYPTRCTDLDEIIKTSLERHGQIMSHLDPEGWEMLMRRTGWLVAASYASTSMKTNVNLYIRQSVIRCSKEYVKSLQDGVDGKVLFQLLNRPWPKRLPDSIEEAVVNTIKELRHVIGMNDESYLPKYAETVTEDLLDLHLFFSRIGILKRPLMPIALINRKYATIDDRIARSMFDLEEHPLMDQDHDHPYLHVLGFSPQAFVNAQNAKRKALRKHQGPKADKIKKKWKAKGKINLPQNGVIRSILTDGIGLSLRLATPMEMDSIKEPADPKKKRKRDPNEQAKLASQMRDEDKGIRPVFVGIDCGRCKLYCGSISKGGEDKPEVKTYTRSRYYWDIGHERRKKEEEEKLQQNDQLRLAREALGIAGQAFNVLRFTEVKNEHQEILLQEHIDSKSYSLRKMRAFRLRKSALAKASNAILDSAIEPGRRLVLGIGTASFPSCGKGSKSAPTKTLLKAFQDAKKRKELEAKNKSKWSPITILDINEFRTTLICATCGNPTSQPFVRKPNGEVKKSSRLRCCTCCVKGESILRDHDVQASRNILELTYREYYGFPRPTELCRQKTSDDN